METVKGYWNKDREVIKNENPQVIEVDMGKYVDEITINETVVKFDESKDFTVGSLIEALQKYDKDMPVAIVLGAHAIGDYDLHIHKVGEWDIYGLDREHGVGIFADNNEDDE